eukprot:TRINITY_DN1357_c0_g1_i9.p1 TRINITY_DN1357_c0_g1~~TRINITY_DN1357_c0_g1_i9.p1  ORF type:complete len:311 (+),score=96.04 TRINITY_DN1357_c0_g1_i9:105-1037(+)
MNCLPGEQFKDILTASQFTRDDVDHIMSVSDRMRKIVKNTGKTDILRAKKLGGLFFEPSTRTKTSFEVAMYNLGGNVVNLTEMQLDQRGESLEDKCKVMEIMTDILVMRHPDSGIVEKIAGMVDIPIINGGDGTGEHPTQALIDVYTIKRELGSVDGKEITIMGDLKYARAAHSLVKVLSNYDVKINFVYPESQSLPADLKKMLRDKEVEVDYGAKLEPFMANSDVVYATRMYKERYATEHEYHKVQHTYTITPETMKLAKDHMILMHPFPRTSEIDVAVDDDPRAAYFMMIQRGVYVRMAILGIILEKL